MQCNACNTGTLKPLTYGCKCLLQNPTYKCTQCDVLAWRCRQHPGVVTRVRSSLGFHAVKACDCTCDPLRSFHQSATVWTSDGTCHIPGNESFPVTDFVDELKAEVARCASLGAHDLCTQALTMALQLYQPVSPEMATLDTTQREFLERWSTVEVDPQSRNDRFAVRLLKLLRETVEFTDSE